LFALGVLIIVIVYHMVRIGFRLPVLQLKPRELLKHVILPAVIYFAILIGSVIYFEIRHSYDSSNSWF